MLHQVKEALRVKMANNEYITLIHDATNEDPWGPTGPQMDDIARVFHNGHDEIMEELILRLKNRKDSWRMCYKSMLVLDHLARNVHESSLPVIMQVAPLLRQISTTYTCNEKNIDRGLSVRERARKLADLLTDVELLREERLKADQTRRKVAGEPISMGTTASSTTSASPAGNTRPTSNSHGAPPPRPGAGPVRTALKQEQEQQDMILAMRLQTEEDRRAQAAGQTIDHGPILVGRTVKGKKSTSNMPQYPQPKTQEEADHFLALEMQRRLDSGEPMTPTAFEKLAFKPASQPAAAATSASGSKASSQPQTSLDDLFGGPTSAAPAAVTTNAPQQQQQSSQALDATSLFTTAASSPPKAQQPAPSRSTNNTFDPFAADVPANSQQQAAGETDFFDNFLAQRKDMHKAPPPQPAPTSSSSNLNAMDMFGSAQQQSKPDGTDLFELQMQRLSTSNTPASASQARGQTLEDMLREGRPM